MSKNEKTGKDAGKKASQLLKESRDPNTKTVAASALTQRPDKNNKKK